MSDENGKDDVKHYFDKSMGYLLRLCLDLAKNMDDLPDSEKEAIGFRVEHIQSMVLDMATMRDCLLDSYNMPWSEYKGNFDQKLKEALALRKERRAGLDL